jgi:hypothetical protein
MPAEILAITVEPGTQAVADEPAPAEIILNQPAKVTTKPEGIAHKHSYHQVFIDMPAGNIFCSDSIWMGIQTDMSGLSLDMILYIPVLARGLGILALRGIG